MSRNLDLNTILYCELHLLLEVYLETVFFFQLIFFYVRICPKLNKSILKCWSYEILFQFYFHLMTSFSFNGPASATDVGMSAQSLIMSFILSLLNSFIAFVIIHCPQLLRALLANSLSYILWSRKINNIPLLNRWIYTYIYTPVRRNCSVYVVAF